MNKRVWIDYSKVREALAFEAVLNHYQIDHPTGRNQVKVLCPFHEEDTASCSINLEGSKFKCFGCNAQGNALEFVVLMEGNDPKDKDDLHHGALYSIEQVLGRAVSDFGRSNGGPKTAPTAAQTAEPGKERVRAKSREETAPGSTEDDQTPNPVLDLQLKLEPDHPFLATRGISPEIAKKWGVGFCNRGIMKGRIAVPIHNEAGELVAYSGRWAEDEVPSDTARYKLPNGFRKSVEVFNLKEARRLALKNDRRFVVVVEGLWSVLRLHEAGIPAVSLLGTTCSEYQADAIRRFLFKYAIVILDGDEAGRNATPAVVSTLARHLYVRSVELPDGVKPDSMSEELLLQLK